MRMRVNGLIALGLVAALLAGCGKSDESSGGSSSTAGASTSAQSNSGGSAAATPTRVPETPGSGKPAQLSGGVIARVDGNSITTATYNHWLEIAAPSSIRPLIANPSDYSGCVAATRSREERNQKLIKENEERYDKRLKGHTAPGVAQTRKPASESQLKLECEEQFKSSKLQAARTLIMRMWTEIKAKELGVSVNESEVAKRVKEREESQKRLAKEASYSEYEPKYSNADLTELMKSEVLETQINAKVREKFAKPGSLSQEKLEKYFNEHKQFYSEPERRAITYLSTKSKSTAEAIAGEPGNLPTAASKHGVSVTSTTVGCQQAEASSEGIIAKICTAKTGAISGPVTSASNPKVPSTYYVFEVKSTTPATKPNFSHVKERIKLVLSSQDEGQAVEKYEEESRAKLRARTECAAGYLMELCKEYKPPSPPKLSKARTK